MNEGEYVDSLVSEYASLLHGRLSNDPQTKHDETGIVEDLASSADWSTSGAHELMKLAADWPIEQSSMAFAEGLLRSLGFDQPSLVYSVRRTGNKKA